MTESTYDSIVIGAGLGGLTTGAYLARAGRDVLVLEQHSIPGGCATTFPRLDFDFEVSLHEIEGDAVDGDGLKTQIFEDLDVLESLSFEPLPEFYHYDHGTEPLTVVHDRAATVDRLVERFPDEAANIRRFFDVITTVREELLEFSLADDIGPLEKVAFPLKNTTTFSYRDTTAGEFLDDTVDSEELKLVLAATLPYFHDDPYELSFPVFAMGLANLFTHGGYYLEGGSQSLSDHLAALITDNGGTIEYDRRVTDILVEDGSATGVRHEHARRGDSASTETADAVVANAAVPLVADELLPAQYGRALDRQVGDWELAPSMTNLYLGFETPPRALGVDHYSTVLQSPAVESLSDIAPHYRGSFGQRTVNFVDYSQVSPDLAPGAKSVGVVTTLDYRSAWSDLTDSEYRQKKSYVKDVLLRRLGEAYPRLPDAVEHAELATPKTLEGYTLNPQGTPYGYAQTLSQSGTDRQITPPVDSLRFASVWTFPGGGYTSAMIAGYRAAQSLLDE